MRRRRWRRPLQSAAAGGTSAGGGEGREGVTLLILCLRPPRFPSRPRGSPPIAASSRFNHPSVRRRHRRLPPALNPVITSPGFLPYVGSYRRRARSWSDIAFAVWSIYLSLTRCRTTPGSRRLPEPPPDNNRCNISGIILEVARVASRILKC